jgi:hypothetical protein
MWIHQRSDAWDHDAGEWEQVLSRSSGDPVKAAGLLLVRILHELEDQNSRRRLLLEMRRPGFKTGYWTWTTGGGETNGLSMIIFDSEENAPATGDRISAIAADARDDVTLDGVEVREVVASA